MKHQGHFSDNAARYAAARPRYPAALYDYIALLACDHDSAWDCACGNGQAAVALARHFERVEATDASAQQVARNFPHPRVHYGVQSAEQTQFDDHHFDAVCVAQALHWFDLPRFWDELQRVLKPDGLFCAWGYSWSSVESNIDDVIEQELLPVIAPYWAAENSLLWNDYRDIDCPLQRIDAPDFAMYHDWTLDTYFDYLRTWSATQACISAMGETFFQKAKTAVAQHWPAGEVKRVHTPLCLLCATPE